jgi:hypothetical protein
VNFVPTFADRGCHVVSVTDLYDRILGFLDRETHEYMNKRGDKDIPLTGREGTYGCETSRLPHYVENRLTDGGEVIFCKITKTSFRTFVYWGVGNEIDCIREEEKVK